MTVKDIIALAQAAAQVGFSFVVVWWLLTRHDTLLHHLIECEIQEKEVLNQILIHLQDRPRRE